MILLNELNGDVVLKGGITLTGDLITKNILLTGSLMNGGTRAYPVYSGEYVFTPTQAEQVIEIKNMRAIDDIVINPIPSNYGLIGWNGATLTVS